MTSVLERDGTPHLQRGDSLIGFADRLKVLQERATPIPFGTYLERVSRGEIVVPRNAYDILYQALTTPQPRELDSGLVEYPAFADRTDNLAVYGLNPQLKTIVDFILSGRDTGGKRRAVLLISASGAGKSHIVNSIKGRLKEHTQGLPVPFYGVAGCPIQEEPLNLLHFVLTTTAQRDQVKRAYGYEICEPCPHCQMSLRVNGYNLEQMPVAPVSFSASLGEGIAKLEHRLTRSKDPASLAEIDRRLLASNRGMLEIAELFQHDPDFLATLNDLIRGRTVQINGQIYTLDTFIIAHTTLAEFDARKRDPKIAPLSARFEIVRVPFNLSSWGEARICRKALASSNLPWHEREPAQSSNSLHIPARTVAAISQLAVLTRLNEPDTFQHPGLTAAKKLQIYNGEAVDGFTKDAVRQLIEVERLKDAGDGFKGLSPAEVEDLLLLLVAQTRETKRDCVNPIRATAKLKEMLRLNRELDSRVHANNWRLVEASNEQWLVECIRMASNPQYPADRNKTLYKYIFNCDLLINNKTTIDHFTQKTVGADLRLLQSLEDLAFPDKKLTDAERADLRQQILYRFAGRSVESIDCGFNDIPEWLRKGIDGLVFITGETLEQVIAISNLESPENSVKEGHIEKKLYSTYQTVSKNLIEQHGFCQHCVSELLQFAGKERLLQRSQTR